MMSESKGGENMKKIISLLNNTSALNIAVILLIVSQPLIDMDYLAYDFLSQFGIPRLSTIIRFVVIPLLILWTFYQRDKHKEKTLLFATIYGVALFAWFYIHCQQAVEIYDDLYLTSNFRFSLFDELTYIATLVMPYGVMYMIYQMNFKENIIKNILVMLSAFIGISILLSNLFVFGISTYEGMTVANIFSWFNNIYDSYHPRLLASKFFFYEGNTIGILMFMILPIMYLFFSKAKTNKEKVYLGSLIFIQSISMIILSTRVATFGTIIVAGAFIVLYIFDTLIMKNTEFKMFVIIFTVAVGIICSLIIPHSPAVINQQIDAKNDLALVNNGAANEGRDAFNSGEPLIPGTTEFNHFYIFQFEEYGIRAKYATSIPSMYYADWYHYKHDPYFWCNMIFNYEVEERVSGRQIQTIFFNEKWKVLNPTQRYFGFGYSTFMNGSIVLEQDFIQQTYTLGYLGVALTMAPWILVVLMGALLVLYKWKELFKLDVLTYAMVVVMGLGAGYTSGHTMDEFLTTMFMAFIVGILLTKIRSAYARMDKKWLD